MDSLNPQINELHRVYVNLTALEIPLTMTREMQWFEWIRAGEPHHTVADLGLVINFIKRGIREQRRYPASLKFSNLIGQPDRFQEDLAEARSAQRVAARQPVPQPGRDAALRATGRPDTREARAEAPSAQPVAAIIPKAIDEGWAAMKAALAEVQPAAPVPPADRAARILKFHDNTQKNTPQQ